MSENYQNSITDQICKVQTSKKLIALYDRLRYTSYNSYAQLHAKGEFEENGHKVHSLIGISIQDYSISLFLKKTNLVKRWDFYCVQKINSLSAKWI